MELTQKTGHRWLYAAIVLNDYSKKLLLQKNVIPSGWSTGCDHVTLCYNDKSKKAEEFLQQLESLVGKFVDIRATGVGLLTDSCSFPGLFALRVTLPENIPCKNTVPHVTLGWLPPMKPRQSNDITDWTDISPIVLMGRIRIIYENN